MTFIGIDQSINSTSVCVDKDNNISYHLIVPHITKKQQNINDLNRNVLTHSYNKSTLDINVKEICEYIASIIANNAPNYICFENISFGSNGRIIDLANLAGYIRSVCDRYNIPYTTVPPTTLKKFAVGNGKADKDVMVCAWKLLDPQTYDLTKEIKNDDLADSYFITQYGKKVYNRINKLDNSNANN